MAWAFKFHPAAAKDLYKLAKKNKPLGQAITNTHLPKITGDPHGAGYKKEGRLSHVWGYGFTHSGTNYRILYTITQNSIRFVAFGIHDIAYRKAQSRT